MQNPELYVSKGDQQISRESSLSRGQNSPKPQSFNSATLVKNLDETTFSEHSFNQESQSTEEVKQAQLDMSSLRHLEEVECQNQLLTLLEYWRGHKERYVFQKDLVNVLVIYTGGTIGMEPSSSGLKARKDFLGDVFRKHILLYDKKYVQEHFGVGSEEIVTPLTNFKHRIRVKLHQISRIEDSSNVDSQTWKEICSVIDKEYANFESFLILHGTDTLAYSASALSFALEGLSRTVILTGAMLPLKDMRSDGYRNLIGSLLIAGHYFIPEVMIYFNNKLLRGNRTIKISASEYYAFDSPNYKPLGEFTNSFKINWKYVLKPPAESSFKVFVHLRAKISSIKVTPLLHQKVFKAAFDPSFDAVVIQGYAMGNFPTRRVELLEVVKSAIQRGVIVVVASQVAKGTVIDSYEVLQQLTKLGALISLDMTFECVLCKLSYLLGKYSGNSKKVKELFLRNLRGELTEKFSI